MSISMTFARSGTVACAVLGMLLVGQVPTHADSVRSDQWHLDVMQAEGMWTLSTGAGVTVAVIDSGVDASNPDLLGQVRSGEDLAPESPGDESVDYSGHGTGMAGIIAGTGESGGGDGAFGLAPGAKILPIRLRNDTGKVNGATGSKNFNDDVSAGIRFAVDHGAKVINISQGKSSGSERLSEAVRYALKKGSLVFAAVGNTGDAGNAVEFPAGTPGVVGVGAVDRNLKKAESSQYGAQVDLSAPGVDMVHACGGKTGLCTTSGTSDASAVASASAALIWSKYPDWTNNQVLRVLLNTAGGAINGEERTDYIGYGIVRPRIALKTPGDPGPADVYPLPDLAAAEAASPSPSAGPSKAAGGAEASGESAQPGASSSAAADDGSSGAGLWIGLGIGAAVLAGAAAAFAVVRSRRRNEAAPAAPPYQPPYATQQPQPPYPPYAPPATGPSTGPGATPPFDGPPHQGGSAG
ncbi:type VII secretion-associated serine protease mycosin [Streptomyces griseus]|uniref:type VII secretion-associated serine protease mycosin n=1 Tax=Streptomyces griseus TaxID=1911 RepID=UPI0008407F05|nr:type VII secretion-associated serine protease mycosin [Streptomyces griseus]